MTEFISETDGHFTQNVERHSTDPNQPNLSVSEVNTAVVGAFTGLLGQKQRESIILREKLEKVRVRGDKRLREKDQEILKVRQEKDQEILKVRQKKDQKILKVRHEKDQEIQKVRHEKDQEIQKVRQENDELTKKNTSLVEACSALKEEKVAQHEKDISLRRELEKANIELGKKSTEIKQLNQLKNRLNVCLLASCYVMIII